MALWSVTKLAFKTRADVESAKHPALVYGPTDGTTVGVVALDDETLDDEVVEYRVEDPVARDEEVLDGRAVMDMDEVLGRETVDAGVEGEE